MLIESKTNSIVKLERLYVDKINFWRSSDEITADSLKVQFTKSYNFNESHTSCIVTLGCIVRDSDNALIEVETSITGHFSCSDESSERRDILLRKNTLSILLPYLRSQISLVTAQPELSPIVLPPMNVEAIFDEAPEV